MKKRSPLSGIICLLIASYYLQNNLTAQTLNEFTPIVIGDKLEDPYTVTNMKTAYEILKSIPDYEDIPHIDIDTTHVYIRFLPNNYEEQAQLLEEELDFYDHPFDYEILKEGDYYHDPSISQGNPTYLYTTVSNDYVIPERINHISYEILNYLFLPDELVENTKSGGRIDAALELLAEKLDDKALEITGNLESKDDEMARRSKYNPSGQILVSNPLNGSIFRDNRRYDGVANVTIRVRRWHKIKKTRTNNDGTFKISKRFRRKVNFGVIYKNNEAHLIAGVLDPNFILYGGAFLNGPKGRHWEYRSERGSSSYKWSTIMNAVHDYHHIYSSQLSIGNSPSDLRIAAYQFNNQAFAPMFRKQITVGTTDITAFIDDYFSYINITKPTSTLLCDVYIDGKNLQYQNLYGVTIHELSHAAHWNYSRNWSTILLKKHNRMVTEAWADGVENEISFLKFGIRTVAPCQILEERIEQKYPRVIVRDLMNLIDACNTDNIIDNVSGFSMSEIFFALANPVSESGLKKWRDNLIDVNPSQKEVLKEYFAQWMEETYIPCNNTPIKLSSNYTSEVTKSVSHTNKIILNSGFKFNAIDVNYRFSGRIDCPLLGSSSRLSVNNIKTGIKDSEEDLKAADNAYIPNTSITYSLPSDYEMLSDADNWDSLSEEGIHLLSLYPNPNKGIFNIVANFASIKGNVAIVVYDMSGRILKQKKYSSVQNIKQKFNISSIDNGVYLLEIEFDKSVLMKRFIIK